MTLLADANIEASLVRWLRSQHHDVVWASELPPSTPDAKLIELANTEERVLLTYDRDFGELVYFRGQVSQGIVLFRFDTPLQAERLAILQRRWGAIEEQAQGQFMVVSEQNVRVRPLPGPLS